MEAFAGTCMEEFDAAMEYAFELWQMEFEEHYHLHKMVQLVIHRIY